MKISLILDDINTVHADGLVLPVDGQTCAIGGTAAAKALKSSFAEEAEDDEEQIELYDYAEKEITGLRPLPHGQARILAGNDRWQTLIVTAAFYHNVNGNLFTPEKSCALLTEAIQNTVNESAAKNLHSIALTLMGTTYRISAKQSILAMLKGFVGKKEKRIEIKWCFLRDEEFQYALQLCDSFKDMPSIAIDTFTGGP